MCVKPQLFSSDNEKYKGLYIQRKNDVTCVDQIDYPEVAEGIGPRHRFMSAYEQRIEPPDRRWQYLLFAAEPYETIAFKVRKIYTSLVCYIVFVFPHSDWCLFFRFPAEKLIKQKPASGPTGTEKLNRLFFYNTCRVAF